MERRWEQARLGELVAWMEEKGGPVTEAELAAAEAERREAGRIFADRDRDRDRDRECERGSATPMDA
ncbi:hypothetical protein [Streptomyces lacrimifluminis]